MSKRLLLIDNSSNCLDMAIRAKAAGWDVRWYDAPRPDGNPRLAGTGMFEKIQDFNDIKRKHLDWADLIYLPDNVKWIDMLEPYRQQGYPILAPSIEAAKLELDRKAGQQAMSSVGIPIMQSKEFYDYDSAISFVKKNPQYLVSKPSGDANKALSYVASDPADLVYMLNRWKSRPDLKKAAQAEGFILQERKYGVEMAVGGWFGPHGFSQYFYENWEYKKLMADDLGVNCYSDDTEVLTYEGWKFWPDVTMDDEICTLNNGNIEFEKPSRLTVGENDKELLHWSSPYVDIMVTPGHQMYVQDDHARKEFWFESADITENNNRKILRGAGWWNGTDNSSMIPSFYTGGFSQWAALIGAYIADGSTKSRSIVFGNCPKSKQEIFTKIAEDAGYKAKLYGTDLYINSVELASYCSEFGKSHEKRVPLYIKNAAVESIKSFLFGYGSGDGTTREGNLTYTTVSKNLADDLQELCLKAGWCANISTRDRRDELPHEINGYLCYNRHVCYDIGVSKTRNKANLSKDISCRVPYSGKVYCCTVTSHIIYVRRNGKACFLGQTGEMGTLSRIVKKSKLAEKVLLPIAPVLEKLGYVGYVDNNCIIDKDGPWPMEWTIRDGWPTKHNVTAHVKNEDPIQWMLDLVNGKDTMECIENEVCVSVLIALPDFPYSKITNKELCGIPIRGVDDSGQYHLSEVMMGIAPTMIADKVVDMPGLVTCGDYTMVVTGTGTNITQARKMAYTAVKKVRIPNSPFYRTDIGAGRMKKGLPILHSMGYAKGLEY